MDGIEIRGAELAPCEGLCKALGCSVLQECIRNI